MISVTVDGCEPYTNKINVFKKLQTSWKKLDVNLLFNDNNNNFIICMLKTKM